MFSGARKHTWSDAMLAACVSRTLYGRAEAVTASAAAAAARRRVGNRVGVRGSRCIALHRQNIGSLFDLLACSYRRTVRAN